MTEHSEGKPRNDSPDADDDSAASSGDQDLHPAIDPREPPSPVEPDRHREAPPIDVDEREDHSGYADTPTVIELADHTEPIADPVETADGVDVARDPESAPEVSGSGDVDSSETFDVIPPPDVLPEDPTFAKPDTDGDDPAPAPTSDTGETEATPPLASEKATPRASAMFAGVVTKMGLGKLLNTTEESGQDEPAAPPAPTSAKPSGTGVSGAASRVGGKVRDFVDPRFHVLTTVPHRRVVATAAIAILVFLLANSGGLALIAFSCIVPILILITITQHDVFEKESNLLIAAVCAGGIAVGAILSGISSWILGSQWFDEGVLNYGAAGFGGRFADAAGTAPVVVWLMVGLVIPAIAIGCMAGIPIGMRRWPQFRNEVMDGMILTGASAAGFSIGASIVYWWPMIADPGPQTNVSDWTLTIIGVGFLRAAVITICGAMIGAGVWRYMLKPSTSVILLPAIGGIGGFLLLNFGSIQLQPSGNWPEFIWTLLIAVAVFVLYRRVLDQAVAIDRQALGAEDQRIVCPNCHKLTPAGAFCAHCGKPLTTANLATSDGPTVPESEPVTTLLESDNDATVQKG